MSISSFVIQGTWLSKPFFIEDLWPAIGNRLESVDSPTFLPFGVINFQQPCHGQNSQSLVSNTIMPEGSKITVVPALHCDIRGTLLRPGGLSLRGDRPVPGNQA